MDIGQRIRTLRERRGWSQEQLGVQARRYIKGEYSREGGRLARATISKIENGHRLPDLWVLEAIAQALGVSLAVLVADPASSTTGQPHEVIMPPWPARVTELAAALGQVPEGALAQLLDVFEGILELMGLDGAGVPAATDDVEEEFADDEEARRLIWLLDRLPEERRLYWQAVIAAEAEAAHPDQTDPGAAQTG